MKYFVTILLIAFLLSAFGQDSSRIIRGKVVDLERNQPVSYTNIGIEGTFYGTASDAEGNFELKVPESLLGKDIFFSAVGYQKRQFPVADLLERPFNMVKLRPETYGVEEVDVAGQNRVMMRILRMASENIKYNFGAGPFNLHCNYTLTATVGDSSGTLKATVLVYDETGYAQPSKIDAFRSRRYAVTKQAGQEDYRFATNPVNVDELLQLDWVRSSASVLNPGLLADFSLSLKAQPVIDGKECWVIAFSQKNPTLEGSGDFYADRLDGEITIDKKDYSVLEISGKVHAPKNSRMGRSLAVPDDADDFFSDVSYSFHVEYRELLLHRVSLERNYKRRGEACSDKALLEVTRAHANNLIVLEMRDYFSGQ